jgi:beta-glucosidase
MSSVGVKKNMKRSYIELMSTRDAENGVRAAELVNAYAASLHIGASWNADLAYKRAQYLGAEFKAKGGQLRNRDFKFLSNSIVNVLLGPVAGPLGRIALGGRNWEGTTNDRQLHHLLPDS